MEPHDTKRVKPWARQGWEPPLLERDAEMVERRTENRESDMETQIGK